jgi:hypothetical protein
MPFLAMPQNRSQTPHKTFMSRSAGSAAKLHSKALSVQEDDDVATNDEENLNLDDLFDSEISSPRSSWASDMEIQMEGNGMESTSLSLPPPASGKLAGSLKSSTNRRKRHGASEKDGVAGGSNPSPAKKQGLANTSQSNQNLQTSSSIASLGGVSSGPKRVKTSDDGGAGMATSSGRPKKPASRATDPNDLSAPLEAVEQSSYVLLILLHELWPAGKFFLMLVVVSLVDVGCPPPLTVMAHQLLTPVITW